MKIDSKHSNYHAANTVKANISKTRVLIKLDCVTMATRLSPWQSPRHPLSWVPVGGAWARLCRFPTQCAASSNSQAGTLREKKGGSPLNMHRLGYTTLHMWVCSVWGIVPQAASGDQG